MLGPTSPFAPGTGDDAEAILDFQLLELDINLIVAPGTYKISSVWSMRIGGKFWHSIMRNVDRTKLSVPSDR